MERRNILIALIILAALWAAGPLYARVNAGVRAEEKRDCIEMQSLQEEGYDVVPPSWCYEEGFLD